MTSHWLINFWYSEIRWSCVKIVWIPEYIGFFKIYHPTLVKIKKPLRSLPPPLTPPRKIKVFSCLAKYGYCRCIFLFISSLMGFKSFVETEIFLKKYILPKITSRSQRKQHSNCSKSSSSKEKFKDLLLQLIGTNLGAKAIFLWVEAEAPLFTGHLASDPVFGRKINGLWWPPILPLHQVPGLKL